MIDPCCDKGGVLVFFCEELEYLQNIFCGDDFSTENASSDYGTPGEINHPEWYGFYKTTDSKKFNRTLDETRVFFRRLNPQGEPIDQPKK